MSVILDASALLALIFRETGHDQVAPFTQGSSMVAVNFSEVAAKVIGRGGSRHAVDTIVDRLEIAVVPFDRQLAHLAAGLVPPTRSIGASFADRACLALGLSTGRPIISADRDWCKLDLGLDIRMIR